MQKPVTRKQSPNEMRYWRRTPKPVSARKSIMQSAWQMTQSMPKKIRQRQRAYNKAHADKRKADYADLIKRAETDPEAARELAEIRAYHSRKTVECYQNLVERAKTDPAAAEKLAQKRQKQKESAKAAYDQLKEQAKTDPEAAKSWKNGGRSNGKQPINVSKNAKTKYRRTMQHDYHEKIHP